jgi:hypothetical protein
VGTLLVVTLAAVIPVNGVFALDSTIEVVVSPKVLNLRSNGGSLSLHTDIGYYSVAGAELYVDDQRVERIWMFPDDRGDLVVKSDLGTVKGMVEVGEAIFRLEVATKDGSHYSGIDTIAVIDRGK